MTQQNNTNKSIKQLKVFAGVCLILLLVPILITLVVDPFFHYHAPLQGFPYVVDHQIDQNPGMASHMTYDSFITGSSMTVNFDADDFSKAFGKTIKLNYDGAYPKNLSIIMDRIFDPKSLARKQGPVKNAFIGLDLLTLTADPEETKFPLTDYLYDQNPFNDIRYLLNKDVFINYIAMPLLRGRGTELSKAYSMTWMTPDLMGRDYVVNGYVPAEKRDEETPKDALVEATKINLEQNILPYVAAHPETEFYFFFPPYSILFWNNVLNENMLEARLNQSVVIGETLLTYKNVHVFYFSNIEEIITNLDNYTDYTHHSAAISAYEERCFEDHSHEVQPGGMQAQVDEMRRIAKSYDFDALLK